MEAYSRVLDDGLSPQEALDEAAIRAAQTARYPAAPSGLPDPSYSFNLPISFQ